MKKLLTLIFSCFLITPIFTQEVCVSKDKVEIDLNTINKCALDEETNVLKSKKAKKIVVSNKRYLRKRAYLNKFANETVYTASDLKSKTDLTVNVIDELNNQSIVKVKKENKEKFVHSFDDIDEIPLFKSCESTSLNKVDCFNYEMEKHIITHFKYPEKALQKGIEGELDISFIINSKGEVTGVEISGKKEYKILKKEAKRIVSLLPKFIPGKQNKKTTNVVYKFPIDFSLD